ncbi:hypothetical protein Btru_058430 [Bulinus truncatus]|nr:hypothetical protein Btru_058430 [Bulinus truncatus]
MGSSVSKLLTRNTKMVNKDVSHKLKQNMAGFTKQVMWRKNPVYPDNETHISRYTIIKCLPDLCNFRHFKGKVGILFPVLAPDEEGNLDKNGINRLMEKILDFTGWDEDSPTFREFQEVHEAFLNSCLRSPGRGMAKAGKVTLDNWLSMWSNILPGS